jgi:GDP-D-mannose dehydratase
MIFNLTLSCPYNESSEYSPSCFYSESKVKAIEIARAKYSNSFRLVNAILFNHESPLRPSLFFSSRVIRHCLLSLYSSLPSLTISYPLNIYDFSRASFFVDLFSSLPSKNFTGDLVFGSSSPDTVASFANSVCYHYNLDPSRTFTFDHEATVNRRAYSDCTLLKSLFPDKCELSSDLDERISLLLSQYTSSI